MTQWIDDTEASHSLGTPRGTLLHDCKRGMWVWLVTWQGCVVKEGAGCVDRTEARREAEHWLSQIRQGKVDPPGDHMSERAELETQLLRARERDAVLATFFERIWWVLDFSAGKLAISYAGGSPTERFSVSSWVEA